MLTTSMITLTGQGSACYSHPGEEGSKLELSQLDALATYSPTLLSPTTKWGNSNLLP